MVVKKYDPEISINKANSWCTLFNNMYKKQSQG